jgi:Tol biopolymer transport system component
VARTCDFARAAYRRTAQLLRTAAQPRRKNHLRHRRGAARGLVRYDTKSKQFVPYLGGISARAVNFSPDGQWISYVSYPDGYLWRYRSDGSDRLRLTSTPLYIDSTSWSPDSREIAMSASEGDTNRRLRLYFLAAAGGTSRILDVGRYNVVAPFWDSEGQSITL